MYPDTTKTQFYVLKSTELIIKSDPALDADFAAKLKRILLIKLEKIIYAEKLNLFELYTQKL
jgi:hypothetical protein